MAADIAQVLRILDHRGVTVRLSQGRLIARPTHGYADALVCIDGQWYRTPPENGPLPNDMMRFIAHFRDQIIAHLAEEERLAETVINILALTPAEQEQYRREVAEAPDDQEHIQHDRESWRRARIQITIAKEIAA